jgi:uncharacterized protein
MAKIGSLVNTKTGEELLSGVRWCSSFLCRTRGLMFRSQLEQGEGLLMVEPIASRAGASIHMLFMRFPIAAIWLDANFEVVDTVLAKPWRLAYAPAKAAKYTLETDPAMLSRVAVGDRLEFKQTHA